MDDTLINTIVMLIIMLPWMLIYIAPWYVQLFVFGLFLFLLFRVFQLYLVLKAVLMFFRLDKLLKLTIREKQEKLKGGYDGGDINITE